MRPSFIRNLTEIVAQGYEKKADGIGISSRDIGAAVGTERLGVDVTTIRPGKKVSRLHHHKHKEEFFYVLEGRCRLRVGMEVVELAPGDAVSRTAGTGVAHQFFNPFPKPCEVLMIGVMNGKGVADECVYPENRLAVRTSAQGKRKLVKLKGRA